MSRTATVSIDLDALSHNLSVVRHYSGTAKVMAVIKANAYGHGLIRVAKHLERQVDALAVACIEEALVLRQHQIKTRIVILQGFLNPEHLEACFQHQLEPVCHQLWQLDLLLGAQVQTSAINIWLKVDTGMHRIGMTAAELESALPQLSAASQIQNIALMSHFANADVPEDALNTKQLATFNQLAATYPLETSMANSAAIVSNPAAIKDWVRPGIMLYGGTPLANHSAADLNLKPVMQLSSVVISLRPLEAGEAIGYGSLWTSPVTSLIAVVSIGYGDGYPRQASVGTPVNIQGVLCSLVGRVSMDMIMVDVTEIAAQIKIGDIAICWGQSPSVDVVAKQTGTIGYELLCLAGKDQ